MWHVTVATAGRWAWFKKTKGLTRAIRAIARVGGDRLLLFAVGDDHGHLVLQGERRTVSQRAGDVVRALSALPGCGVLQPSHFKPVTGRAHLENLLGYLVTQPSHHGHAAIDLPGTCLSDLVGARMLPGYSTAALAAELPRRHLATEALRAVGLPVWLRSAKEVPLGAIPAAALWAAVVVLAAPDRSGRAGPGGANLRGGRRPRRNRRRNGP